MRILLSADCLYPAQVGGPSNAIYWQAKALTLAGHAVTVVATSYCLPPTVPRDQWLNTDFGQVIYTRTFHFYVPFKHIWYGWWAMQTADIVHVNSFFYPASLVWVILCRLLDKPVVWSPHGELNPVALGFRRRLKQFIVSVVRRLNLSVTFHATSLSEATHIQAYLGAQTPVVVIPNHMELPQRISHVAATSAYILFIGRLHPIKAIDRLIIAVGQSTLFRTNHYKLLIAGPTVDAAYERNLKRMVEKLGLLTNVEFIGAVQGARKEALYANARLTVLPSHAENFGNVVIESLAQGTPVIASTHTPWQLLNDEQIGSWVENNPDVLQRTIDQYLRMSPVEYKEYRERASRVARQQFDSMKNNTAWECLYKQLVTQPNRETRHQPCMPTR